MEQNFTMQNEDRRLRDFLAFIFHLSELREYFITKMHYVVNYKTTYSKVNLYLADCIKYSSQFGAL